MVLESASVITCDLENHEDGSLSYIPDFCVFPYALFLPGAPRFLLLLLPFCFKHFPWLLFKKDMAASKNSLPSSEDVFLSTLFLEENFSGFKIHSCPFFPSSTFVGQPSSDTLTSRVFVGSCVCLV